jgi:PKD repeat protein
VNNQRPVADAGGDREVNVGDTVVFDGASSYDPDGRDLIRYYWTFGNGLTRTAIVASTVYDRPGTFTVTLTVTDACRSRTTDSITVTVLDNGADPCEGNRAPVANAGSDQNATIGQLLLFNGAGSSDPENSISTYHWSFGDGSSAQGRNPTHAYSGSGSFNVTLTVTDDCGATSTDSSIMATGRRPPAAAIRRVRSTSVRWSLSTAAVRAIPRAAR